MIYDFNIFGLDEKKQPLRVRSLFGVWNTVVSSCIAASSKSVITFLGCAAEANVLTVHIPNMDCI